MPDVASDDARYLQFGQFLNMQDWSSKVWIKANNQQIFVEDMSLLECLQAIWAMYVLSSKNNSYINLPYTTLGRSVYSRLRTLQTELEFKRLR